MLNSVDLFCGAGGLSEGFRQAGFRPVLATDFDSTAAETFKLNFPDVPFLLSPISEIPGEEIMRVAGVGPGDVDVLLGGPPCQSFSVCNHQRGLHDERSGLFREYLRIVECLRPRAIVMENVTGMRSVGKGRVIDEIHLRLQALGYSVEHRILKAEQYGVPQKRRRIFFIGVRNSTITWPEPTHGARDDLFAQQLPNFVTVGEAIDDLPELSNGECAPSGAEYSSPPSCEYQRRMREGATAVHNHEAANLGKKNMRRISFIEQGGSWRDLPRELLPAGMKKARRSDHTKRYGRLDPQGLFSTILTKADMHWGAFIHPTQDRTITVRECARAQSFPDRFKFVGNRTEQYRQVGNAVPPLLATAVAESIVEMLDSGGRDQETEIA